MNEGMYTNIRTYLEELASLGKQQIEEQKRTNELLNEIRLATNRTDGRAKDIAEEVEAAMVKILDDPKPARKAGTTLDMGNLGPISAETGEPIRTAAKKGK